MAESFPYPGINRLLESSLYVADLSRALEFYRDVLGLEVISSDSRFCALNVAGGSILLLFLVGDEGGSVSVPGGVIPGHYGRGQLHLAFAISADSLQEWEKRLFENSVEIESRVTWPKGGISLYFRDPDGHLVELATPGIWPNY